MKITRTPLALLALAAFAPAFAGGAGSMHSMHSMHADAPSACQMASCTMKMDMAHMRMAKPAHDAPAPEATGSWYLPTWKEAKAATNGMNGMMACDEVQSPAAPAVTAPTAWYLPTWEDAAATAVNPMDCCETACPMNQASHAQPAPSEKPAESWYLPS